MLTNLSALCGIACTLLKAKRDFHISCPMAQLVGHRAANIFERSAHQHD